MPRRKTVAVDFDGVIHAYTRGWQKGVIYDEPQEGCAEALYDLYSRFDLVVFTVREDLQAVKEWLSKHDLLKYFREITNEKPIACLYIDDRGLRHRDWQSTLRDVSLLDAGGLI